MTSRKTRTTRKGQVKKLKLQKETLKDLDARRKARGVKAGRAGLTDKTVCGQLVPCL
jgi:hypothetical protein